MKYVLAIDQGTTGSTCLMIARDGTVKARTDDGAPLRVDGGASSNGWLMQFQADVLGCPVERPEVAVRAALSWARDPS